MRSSVELQHDTVSAPEALKRRSPPPAQHSTEIIVQANLNEGGTLVLLTLVVVDETTHPRLARAHRGVARFAAFDGDRGGARDTVSIAELAETSLIRRNLA